ncbi:MAG: adenylate cyclase, partial [Saprospiraceae bacterium]|nr:adenylate cyclase [Saprospiraceae bacterium]
AQKIWEVDVFLGENIGLIVAEIELEHEEESFALPEWIEQEVTDDARYYNANLTLNPFGRW